MGNFVDGLQLLLTPQPLFWMAFGVIVGFVIGVLPGFSGSNATALALPFSIALRPENALILMASIYAGSAFGGSLPGILMNVPGTPESVAATLDGYPMALQGKARLAIGVSRMASVCGGVLSAVTVLVIIGPMSQLSLKFGPRELVVVALFGLIVIGTLLGDDRRKGLIAALLGLLIAAMSASPLTAQPRFTMGFLQLYDNVPFVPAVIGVFALTQMFVIARRTKLTDEAAMGSGEAVSLKGNGIRAAMRDVGNGVGTTLGKPWLVLRSSIIGMIIGIIPGTGTTVGNFVSYADARRRSKHPESFGKGNPEGIIAGEACDNAVTSATLVPTLTLGIPGSGTAAVMLASLYLHGIQPGPEVMQNQGPQVYAVLFSILGASLLIFPFGVIFATPLTQITRIPPAILVPFVLLLSAVGVYAIRNSFFDVGLAFVFGLLGLIMRQFGYPVVPLIMGLILGPILEKNLMLAIALGRGELSYFFGSVTVNVLWALLAVLIGYTLWTASRKEGNHGDRAGDGSVAEHREDDSSAPGSGRSSGDRQRA